MKDTDLGGQKNSTYLLCQISLVSSFSKPKKSLSWLLNQLTPPRSVRKNTIEEMMQKYMYKEYRFNSNRYKFSIIISDLQISSTYDYVN